MSPRILERAEHRVSRRDIDSNVLKVLYRLIAAGHDAYLVGGGVRDLMLGRVPKDFDVATSAHPNQVRELFRNSRLIGRRFRLVHVFFGRQNVEVATFRRRGEEEASGADPLIRHDNSFGTAEEDAFRRDFTVNALFYDPRTFRVIDYAGGVDDLAMGLIRTIGEPEIRVREDPVRMMRAVRFAAKLGFEIESGTRIAIERHCPDLMKSSAPRVVEETYRTLVHPSAARALVLMEDLGLLEMVLPALSRHLKSGHKPLAQAPTVRNLAALGQAITDGLEASHAHLLACLLLDVHLAQNGGRDGRDLMTELRLRGFARADTEQSRLWLETVPCLANPSRRTLRLSRRPYFGQACEFYRIIAGTYSYDPSKLEAFLADPQPFLAASNGHPASGAGRRRRGRRRRNRRGPRRVRTPDSLPGSSDSSPLPSHDLSMHASANEDRSPLKDRADESRTRSDSQ